MPEAVFCQLRMDGDSFGLSLSGLPWPGQPRALSMPCWSALDHCWNKCLTGKCFKVMPCALQLHSILWCPRAKYPALWVTTNTVFMLSVVIPVFVLMEICNHSTQQSRLDPFGDVTIPQGSTTFQTMLFLCVSWIFCLGCQPLSSRVLDTLLDQANKKKSLSYNWFESLRKRLEILGENPASWGVCLKLLLL